MSRQSQDTQESNRADHLCETRQSANISQNSEVDPTHSARSYAGHPAAQLSLTGSADARTSPRTEHDSPQVNDHAGSTPADHGPEAHGQAAVTAQGRVEAQEAPLAATELDMMHAALAREELDDAERTKRVNVIEWAFRNQDRFDWEGKERDKVAERTGELYAQQKAADEARWAREEEELRELEGVRRRCTVSKSDLRTTPSLFLCKACRPSKDSSSDPTSHTVLAGKSSPSVIVYAALTGLPMA